MNSQERKIAGMEHQLTQARKATEFAEKVRKLVESKLFREVIIEQFSTVECSRYVQESCDPLLSAENRADALALAQASGHLKRWIEITLRMGDTATSTIADLQQELELARSMSDSEDE